MICDNIYQLRFRVGSNTSTITCRQETGPIFNTIALDLLTNKLYLTLTPWLMEPGGSMPHSQGLSNNYIPRSKSHVHFSLPWSFQIIRPVPRPCVTFLNTLVFTV